MCHDLEHILRVYEKVGDLGLAKCVRVWSLWVEVCGVVGENREYKSLEKVFHTLHPTSHTILILNKIKLILKLVCHMQL